VDLIFELCGWAFGGCLDAVGGALCRPTSSATRRLHRACVALLFCGIACIVVAIAMVTWTRVVSLRVVSLWGLSVGLLIAGGVIGNRVQSRCKTERAKSSEPIAGSDGG
jgi:hypothetical protein